MALSGQLWNKEVDMLEFGRALYNFGVARYFR